MAGFAALAEPADTVTIFGPREKLTLAINAGRGFIIVRGKSSGFVSALYAAGAWAVLPGGIGRHLPADFGSTSDWAEHPKLCYRKIMTIEDIEKAIEQLPPDQFAKFRAWFEELDAARFDDKIARDVPAGKLDRLAEAAITDFRKGLAREI